jgi:hypothetical protein
MTYIILKNAVESTTSGYCIDFFGNYKMQLNKEEHIELLGTIGSINKSSRFFRKRALQLHPDKNQDNPNATPQFKLLNNFKEICNNPSRFVKYGEEQQSISKQYTSTYGPNEQQWSTTSTVSVNLILYNDQNLLETIKMLYGLDDEQIKNISQKLNNYLFSFMQNIFYVQQATSFEKILFSHKMPDKDLMLLLKNDHLATDDISPLLNLINTLKIMPPHPNYYNFNADVNNHVDKVINVINLFQANNIFHANLLQIFLHLAYTHKEEQQKSFWSGYKKGIVELLDMVLKIPIYVFDLSFEVAFFLFFGMIMPIFLASWLSAASGLPLIICILAAGAIYISAIIEYGIFIHNFFDAKTELCALCSEFIDESLEKAFDVKFFATELATLSYDIQKMQLPFTDKPEEQIEDNHTTTDNNTVYQLTMG